MGILHFEVNGESRDILVGDGIAEVTPAYVMVLVDSACLLYTSHLADDRVHHVPGDEPDRNGAV